MGLRAERYLIVNADDFGQSAGVNRGVIEAYEHGIVTSASLMVRWPAAEAAAAYAKQHPSLSVGLHVDFGEWRLADSGWTPIYHVVDLDDREAVRREAFGQLERFRSLLGADPTHVDSHQHVHRSPEVHAILQQMAADLAVPLRGFTEDVHYCGAFYGQRPDGAPDPERLRPQALIRMLARLPPGISELGCHPGYGDDLQSMYTAERERELAALCHPAMKVALAAGKLTLCSYHGLPAARGSLARSAAPTWRWLPRALFGR